MVATVTCGYWALERWLAQTEMCYNVHTGSQKFSIKSIKYLINNVYIDYMLK